MMRRERFILKVYRRLFLIFGLNLDSSTRKYEKYYLFLSVIFYLTLILPQLMAYPTANHFFYKLNIFSQIIMTASALIHIAWFFFVREKVIAFHNFVLINSKIFDDPFCDNFEGKLRSRFYALSLRLLPLIGFSFMVPIIVWNLSYSEGVNNQYYFFLQSVYPWDTSSPEAYTLTLLLQMPVVHGMALFIFGLFIVCYCHTFFSCMDAQLMSLIREVDAQEYSRYLNKHALEVHLIRDLGRIIFYHEMMSKLVQNFNVILNSFTHLAVLYMFLTGSVTTLMFFMPVEGTYNYHLVHVKHALFSFIGFSTLAFQLPVGEFFHEFNNRVLFDMYSMRWYQRPIRYRKTMITFLTSLQKSQGIKVYGVWILNQYFFTRVCNFSYSAFQILKKMQNKT